MCVFLLSLLLFSVFGSKVQPYAGTTMKIKHYPNSVTWESAQTYCRKHHVDLVTLRNEQDNVNFIDAHGWIGMFRENAYSQWKWSHGNETAGYNTFITIPWKSEHCVFKYRGAKTWHTDPCDTPHSFTCFDEKLVLVRENKTWEEALRHCRSLGRVSTSHSTFTHLYDLASLITDDDHILAREKAQNATTDEVWTGLRFLAGQWWWLDRGPMLYQDIDRCPTGRSCGVIEKKGNANFSTRNCEERRNFLCCKEV